MSYLGRYYVSMEQDKTELEKVLDVYSAAKQIKYIYDEKNKLIPVDRIGKIGKGVCYDHCRYQGMLAKNYGLEYRCYVLSVLIALVTMPILVLRRIWVSITTGCV